MKKKEDILTTIEMLKSVSQFICEKRAKICDPHDVSPVQSIVLLDIYHHPKETKITDICKRLNKTTNTISPLIKRLEEKGYLNKKQNLKDNRIFEVFFTEFGMQMMEAINQDVLGVACPIFNSLTDEDFEVLYQSLVKLNKACGLS